MKEKKIIIIQIVGLTLIDQLMKLLMICTNIKIDKKIGLYINENELTKSSDNGLYILISFIIIMILVRYIKNNNTFIKTSNKIVVSFAIAGVITNTIDRIWKGCVIGYINFPYFFSINLGYIYIIIAWVGLAVILTKNTVNQIKEKKVKKIEKDKSRR